MDTYIRTSLENLVNETWDITLISPIRIPLQYSQLWSQLAAFSKVQNRSKIRSLRSCWALGSNILLLPTHATDIWDSSTISLPPNLKLVFLMEDGIDFPSPESGAAWGGAAWMAADRSSCYLLGLMLTRRDKNKVTESDWDEITAQRCEIASLERWILKATSVTWRFQLILWTGLIRSDGRVSLHHLSHVYSAHITHIFDHFLPLQSQPRFDAFFR